MNKKNLTYKKSGVNIAAADSFVKFISSFNTKDKGKKKFSNIGGFGSITNIPKNFKKPKIVACTDGVGTKIEIANLLNKFDTIGVFILWLGWFGFNGGSQLAMGTADDAIAISTIFINTFLAGAGGVMGAATITRLHFGKTDVIQMLNGAIGWRPRDCRSC